MLSLDNASTTSLSGKHGAKELEPKTKSSGDCNEKGGNSYGDGIQEGQLSPELFFPDLLTGILNDSSNDDAIFWLPDGSAFGRGHILRPAEPRVVASPFDFNDNWRHG